jgi:KaiC/GvpD/RAD55 family RecA-like ATPase
MLGQDLYIKTVNVGYSFTSHEHRSLHEYSPTVRRERHVPLLLTEEMLDPLAAIRTYLIRACGCPGESVGHEMQMWILRISGLSASRDFRLTLAKVCERVNQIFFGYSRPPRSTLRTQRGASIGTSLLLNELESVFAPELGRGVESTRAALGIYLFLRLRRLLRFTYQAIRARDDAEKGSLFTPPDRAHVQKDDHILMKAAHHRQCASMLRPIDFSFLQTAIYGLQTDIPGLNFVFRGGLLPRPHLGRSFIISGPAGSGKTLFALQLLTDIAAKGGAAVYFSFEEDYDSLLARMVTFNLLDDTKFDVIDGQRFPSRDLAAAGRGVLLLYTAELDKQVPIVKAIEALATHAPSELRALAIDSVNAADMGASTDSLDFRLNVDRIVRSIDQGNFFGLILSEADDEKFEVVPYLVDTVISLTQSAGNGVRLLEIPKCRTQNMHRGPHPYHITERRGITIYPALASIRDTIRQLVPGTLSERRAIPLPRNLGEGLGLPRINEKGSVLVTGGTNSGATLFGMQLLTEPRVYLDPHGGVVERTHSREAPDNLLVVTFNLSETKFAQTLRKNPVLFTRWQRSALRSVRWFSPGEHLTGDQILTEIGAYILQGRRYGVPVERILFHEIHLAERLLPLLEEQPLFWPTVLQLLNTEGISSIFIADEDQFSNSSVLQSEVDYVFSVGASSGAARSAVVDASGSDAHQGTTRYLSLLAAPGLLEASVGREVPLRLGEHGLIE